MTKAHVLIIGAGFTGTAAAYDLAQRGLDVIVLERGALASGTSGRTHGLLHSGGRYVVKDHESAAECIIENQILRQIVPQIIEPNGGLFVALEEEDLVYGEKFEEGCEICGIPSRKLTSREVLQIEPNVNPNVLMAYLLPSGTFDPLRLAMSFAASAQRYGAKFRLYQEVQGIELDGRGNVIGVQVMNQVSGISEKLFADMIVNATGAWAGCIARMAGCEVPVAPTPGVMVAVNQRLAERVINRLRPPCDGDLALPQRRMMVIGTTSYAVDNPDYVPVIQEEVERMLECGAELLPGIRQAKRRGCYTATRPLIASGGSGRSLARTFKCFDHEELNNIQGFITITGGKATTLRLMAEKVSDMVYQKLGLAAQCCTAALPLASYRQFVER
jgi:glycerol-3-phosphate dehydrogenase